MFNSNQPRDDAGRWSGDGGGSESGATHGIDGKMYAEGIPSGPAPERHPNHDKLSADALRAGKEKDAGTDTWAVRHENDEWVKDNERYIAAGHAPPHGPAGLGHSSRGGTSDDILIRSAGRIASTLNRAARTVEGVACSGMAPAVRDPRRGDPSPDGTGQPWVEELDPAGADLAAFRGLPVLLDHQLTTRAAVGTVADARLDNGQIVVSLRFDPTPEAERTMAQVESGSVRGLSVGYVTKNRQKVGATAAGLPVFRATAWKPIELSFVPVPVDPGATVRGITMTTAANTATDATAGGSAAVVVTTMSGAVETRADINRQIRGIASIAGLDQAWIDGQIDAGADADTARRTAFETMARRGRTVVDNRSPHITVGTDYSDPQVLRRGMSDALAHRLAPAAVKLEGMAVQFRGLPALAMLGRLAAARGETVDPWDRGALLTRAIGAHSSSDFPLLLADAANKALLAQYVAATPSYRQIAAPKSLNDFKAHNFLRLGDFPTFKPLAETGEVQYGTISENREQVKAKEFATGIVIGRSALINDDLSALSDFSSLIAIRAGQFENGQVYALVANNGPTMADGKALFHADHGNVAASGTAPSTSSIGAAVQAFRMQTGLDGARLNIGPKFLVVGPALETAARQQLAQINPVQVDQANIWANVLTLIVDAEIAGNRWHLIADPAQVPSLVYGYVGGAQGPQVKTETDFDTQSVKVRAGLDFAAGAIDFRGLYLNSGA